MQHTVWYLPVRDSRSFASNLGVACCPLLSALLRSRYRLAASSACMHQSSVITMLLLADVRQIVPPGFTACRRCSPPYSAPEISWPPRQPARAPMSHSAFLTGMLSPL